MIEITNASRRPQPGSAAASAEAERMTPARPPSFRMMAGSAARAAEEARSEARLEQSPATGMAGMAGITLRATRGRVFTRPTPEPESLHQVARTRGAVVGDAESINAAKTAARSHRSSGAEAAQATTRLRGAQTPRLLARAVGWLSPLKLFNRVQSDRGTAGNPPASNSPAGNLPARARTAAPDTRISHD